MTDTVPVNSPDPLVGTVLSERYRVSREIGQGGMATVYEAVHVEIGKRVAVKVLHPEMARSPVVVERFLREARAAAAVRSPHICDVFDAGSLPDGRPFLVLELLEGESLYARLARERRLAREEVTRILTQVARGLAKAHDAGIIHRDLKPENIFLAVDDDQELAKILDFGLAKFYAPVGGSQADQRLTREGAVFGTPAYMSPEQLVGQGTVDARADLWALGCIAFEALTGRTVWSTEQGVAMVFAQIATARLPVPSQLCPDLPAAFDAWFARALDRDIDRRFQTARDFASELAIALGQEPVDIRASVHLQMEATPAAPPSHDPSHNTSSPIAFAPTQPPPAPAPASDPAPGRDHLQSVLSTSASIYSRTSLVPARRSRHLWLWSLGAIVAVAAAGYGGWMALGQGPGETPASAAVTGSPTVAASAGASAAEQLSAQPAASWRLPAPIASDAPPWVALVANGQALLASGQGAKALAELERAAQGSTSPVARMMSEHARTTLEPHGSCELQALGRPRPYDRRSSTRAYDLVSTPQGLVAIWVDAAEGPEQWHAYTAALDESLRASSPIDVTPEARSVGPVRLVRHGPGLLLVYAERLGDGLGLHARRLDLSGRVQSPPLPMSKGKTAAQHVTVAAAGDDAWVVFSDESPGREGADLFARRLDASMSLGSRVRLTRYGRVRDSSIASALAPAAAIAGDQLIVVHRSETPNEHDIVAQRIGLNSAELAKGLDDQRSPNDVLLGASSVLTLNKLKVRESSVTCQSSTCLVAWRNEPAGGTVVRLHAGTGELEMRQVLTGSATALAVSLDQGANGLVAWHEGNRVRVAPVQDGRLSPHTPIGRVDGEQPMPAVVSLHGGSWAVAWSCYEGGRPETYVARVVCR